MATIAGSSLDHDSIGTEHVVLEMSAPNRAGILLPVKPPARKAKTC